MTPKQAGLLDELLGVIESPDFQVLWGEYRAAADVIEIGHDLRTALNEDDPV